MEYYIRITNFFVAKKLKNNENFEQKNGNKKVKNIFKKVLTKQKLNGTIKNVLDFEKREQSTLKNKQ